MEPAFETCSPSVRPVSPPPRACPPGGLVGSSGWNEGQASAPQRPPPGPCCPAPPVLGAGPPWTPRPCQGPSTTADGVLPTQTPDSPGQALPACISRLRRPLCSSMCSRTAVCSLWCELGPRPGRRQALDETLATLGLGTLAPSGPPSRGCGYYRSRPVPGIHVAAPDGTWGGEHSTGTGADWASESTDPSPIFLFPKELGRQVRRERFLLSLLWGLTLL